MRILIVDDEPAMHESYRHCFEPVVTNHDALSDMAAELFADASVPVVEPASAAFDTVHCNQGLDAVAAVEDAIADGNPLGVALIDVGLAPGIDG